MKKLQETTISFLKRYWLHLVLALALVLIYRGWLMPGPLVGGDWPYYNMSRLVFNFRLPFAWYPSWGLGISTMTSLFFYPPYFLMGLLATLHVPAGWCERLVFFYPCVVLSAACAYYFGKTLFKDRKAACITAAVFSLNSYFLKLAS